MPNSKLDTNHTVGDSQLEKLKPKRLLKPEDFLNPNLYPSRQEVLEFLKRQEEWDYFQDPSNLPSHSEVTSFFKFNSQWDAFCFNQEQPVFEFLNKEYVNALSDYLVTQISTYKKSKDNPLTILEIGAGNGRLSHFLRLKLNQLAPNQTRVMATDSGGWNLETHFPVEQLDHTQALNKYNPDIVI